MLYLYSWNVLSPNINVNLMTWKNKYDKPLELAKLDEERFTYRKSVILKIINHWLEHEYVAICLQEVCKELLEDLLLLKCHVFYTRNVTMKKKDIITVTIIKGYNTINEEVMITDNRSILKTTIKNMNIFNVHLHWTWEQNELRNAGKLIYESINTEKFVICGDMNKPLTELVPFINEFDCIRNNIKVPHTGIYTKTGLLDTIDHIFISASTEPIGKISVYNSVLSYKILYNIEKIIKLHKKGLTSERWKRRRYNKDVSDHKPIGLIINC